MSGRYQGQRVVTVTEACAIVGVCRRTIYDWIDAGKLQTVRTAGGSPRIVESSLWAAPAREDAVSGHE